MTAVRIHISNSTNDRHCERSEAIHGAAKENGLLRRFAPRNDGKHSFAISPRVSREFYLNFPSPEFRGRRECRALDAPQPRVQMKKAHEHSHHGHTGTTRHSPRNGFTAYFALSPVTTLA